MNKLVFYEPEFGGSPVNNRMTVCEGNVWWWYLVDNLMQFRGLVAIFISLVLVFFCFFAFFVLSSDRHHSFVLVCPLPLKNRLIPLWHAICGWVIDSGFFLFFLIFFSVVLVVLQKLFSPPTFKQFPNKLFIPNFSNCFLSKSSAKVLFANCFFPSFSPHCSQLSCFLHQM